MNKQLNKKEILAFIKKYGYIFVLSIGLLVLAIVMAIMAGNPEDNTTPTNSSAVTFYSPILNATVAKGYSDTTLMYNTTLKQWEAHKAVTYTTVSQSDVFAVLDGTVKEIYNNYLEGTVVVLEHAGNLTTSYGSLGETVSVKVGDIVHKGDVIGQSSDSANSESDLGVHMRFELKENNVTIDPTSYLNLENK